MGKKYTASHLLDKNFLMELASGRAPDMSKLNPTALATEDMLEVMFDRCIEDIGSKCEGCKYLDKTKDGYGTGDSPTLLECEGSGWRDCQRVSDIIEYIKGEL